MFHNYFKIIWRNLYRYPVQAVLNLSCLTVGVAAAILILLYVDFEINYDGFHAQADRIYRIETTAIETHQKVMDVEWTSTAGLLGPYAKQDIPEIASYTRVYNCFLNEVFELEHEGDITESREIAVVDSSMLEVFSFDFIHGDPKTALNGPGQMVLSQSLAQKIFGATNPIGEILTSELTHFVPDFDPNYSFVVSGVYKDLPRNSHLILDGMISSASDPNLENYYFKRFTFQTYALLHESANPQLVAEKLPSIYDNYLDPAIEPVMKKAIHSLVALPQIHQNETGGYTYVYLFAAIGFLMLLIAIISYVNLVTAQASKRTLEVGVRKVMGSSRGQLMIQFLSESFVFSSIALSLALSLVVSTLPLLNEYLNLQLSATPLEQPRLILCLLALLLLLGFLGGSYPAFFLSSFQPISMMKGKISQGAPLRRILVAVEFAVVIFVLISTGMVYEQLQYLQKKDLGFNRDQIIQVNLETEEEANQWPVFSAALKRSPQVIAVGTSGFLPGTGMGRRPIAADAAPEEGPQFVHFGRMDYDYLATVDIALLEGRNFSTEHPGDQTQSIIVNETLAKNFDLENPVGEKIRFGDKGNPNFVTIVGVVEDFHESSLHHSIGAQMFLLEPQGHQVAIKIGEDMIAGIDHVEKTWATLFPNEPFTYSFLDETIQAVYEVDQIRGNIFLLFSLLTIFITFLGLFGLVAYIARQRVQEIGIRKVLGAGLWDIVVLISKDFLLLLIVAAIPAFAVAWYFVNQWLTDFAYHTEMNYLVFGSVFLFTLMLTFMTTSLHAARVTQLNPADTLKKE